jgi:ribonucleotide reductase alpha subunit
VASLPSATARINAIRPRGLLVSCFVASYVGQVGKHIPQ